MKTSVNAYRQPTLSASLIEASFRQLKTPPAIRPTQMPALAKEKTILANCLAHGRRKFVEWRSASPNRAIM
jgi:hypothetical protein